MTAQPESRAAKIVRVLEAYHAGTLSEHEADVYLRTEHHLTLEQAHKMADPRIRAYDRRSKLVVGASLALLLVLVASVLLYTPFAPSAPSGLAVLDLDTQASSDTALTVPDPVTALSISGTLTGEGTATVHLLASTGESYLVGVITSDDGSPRTAQASYQPGELVEIEHLPEGATVYLDDGATTTVTAVPFGAPASTSELLIVANDTGNLSATRIPLVIGDAPRTTAFDNLCIETCTLPTAVEGELAIAIDGTATIDIHARGTTPEPNRAPIVAIPFDPLTLDTTLTIQLDTHIIDEDGDDLLFSTGITDLVDVSVQGDTLTLTPLRDGTVDLAIYASDLNDLIETSIPLTVVASAPAPAPTNATNDTTNTTLPPPPTVPAVETNATNETTNATLPPLDCTGTDPNRLPTECLLQNADAYFPDEEIFLSNLDREPVAKLNMVGNLLITGDVIEYSSATPGRRDFTIGQPDRDGNIQVAAWVDSATGDLHLRGALYEEEVSIVPPAGSYSILTRRSIYLAYVDLSTGDLHLRGNLIPYRRSLT